jgi:hypothetical protein
MGLPVLAVAACSGGWPAPQKTTHTTAWIPELPERDNDGLPTCPGGAFCVPAPVSVEGATAAAPFQMCADKAPMPEVVRTSRPENAMVSFYPAATENERRGDPAACCYSWVIPCPGGRPLRGSAGALTAETVPREGWASGNGAISAANVAVSGLPAAMRARLAAHWAREAAFEHASVASFGRAALALLAHGAPSDLVARAHAAALDEIEHARIGYALSTVYSGAPQGPAPLPLAGLAPLPASVADLAVETFLDGCVNETVAALALAEAADRAEDPALCALLRRIAADEERHAELGWITVGWAVKSGGPATASALAAAVASLEAEIAAAPPQRARPREQSDTAAHGLLGDPALAASRRAALAQVVLPCAKALLTSATHAARRATPAALAIS